MMTMVGPEQSLVDLLVLGREDLAYAATVDANPRDFSAWELLLRTIESRFVVDKNETSLRNVQATFKSFLRQFPLCFGYWKRFADFQCTNAGREAAREVRGFGR